MDTEDREQSAEPPPPDRVLGQVSPGERDSQLGEPASPSPAASHRRYGAPDGEARPPAAEAPKTDAPPAAEAPAQEAPGSAPPADAEGAPVLPRGALVVMRVSGGLRFSSREVVVYRDGRVVQRRHTDGISIYRGASQRLSQEQLAELQHLIERFQAARLADTPVRQSPDTLAFEIIARAGRRLKTAEAFTGSIPETLAPLISWLGALMPRDE